MHRVTVLYPEPADVEEFERRYAAEHVPLVRSVPGLERFTLSHPAGPGGATPYLVAELWFADAEALRTAMATPEMAEAAAHAATLGVTGGPTTFAGEVEDLTR